MTRAEKIILGGAIIINTIFWVLLMSGNLSLRGLQLTGDLKSSAEHKHGRYDNSFITGVDYVFNETRGDFDALVRGSSLEAVNFRAPSGCVSAGIFVNNGALYQHGNIMFAEDNNFQRKKVYLTKEQTKKFYTVELTNMGFRKDARGWYKEDIDPLAVGFVNCSGLIQIIPDYKRNGLEVAGTYIDREGVHKVSQEEVERIKKECKDEIRKELLDAPVVKKGKK